MEKNKGGRPRNPVTDEDFKSYLKKCAKLDLPKIRARLLEIALGNAKDEHFDSKTGRIIKKSAPLSVCNEAMSIYLGKVFSKIEADAKSDTNIKVTHSVTDALKEVEAKKRAEYEKKHQKELEAKEAGKLAKRAING